MNRHPRIFLSYASEDRPTVEKIRQDLLLHEFQPWMDDGSLRPGEPWEKAIRKQIGEADFFLAILSRNSAARKGVYEEETELAYSLWQQKDPESIRLIPVRLDETKLPAGLGRLHRVDYPAGWPKLVTGIREEWKRRQQVHRRRWVLGGAGVLASMLCFYFYSMGSDPKGRTGPESSERPTLGLTYYAGVEDETPEPAAKEVVQDQPRTTYELRVALTDLTIAAEQPFRILAQTSVPEGYLTLLSQEVYTDGRVGAPKVLRVDHPLGKGGPVLLPPRGEIAFLLRPNGPANVAELITCILSRTALAIDNAGAEAGLENWKRTWGAGVDKQSDTGVLGRAFDGVGLLRPQSVFRKDTLPMLVQSRVGYKTR